MDTILKSGEHKFSSSLTAITPYFKGIYVASYFANLLKFS